MTPFRVALLAAAAITGALLTTSAVVAQTDLPDGEGKDTVMNSCTACHGVDVILMARRTPDDWRGVVDRMVGNGASLSDEQYATVVKYLSTSMAPQPQAAAPAAAAAADPITH